MLSPDVAYAPAQWSSFLSAEADASAALTGLLFVAVSINLAKIVAYPHLVPRAAKALVTLVAILFAASLCLVPGQPNDALGSELILLGASSWIMVTRTQRGHVRGNPYINRGQRLLNAVLAQMSVVPLIVCGASLLCSRGGGLYWLVVATIFAFASALLDAWVLLIEIMR
jgi:modulator of FtsH protease